MQVSKFAVVTVYVLCPLLISCGGGGSAPPPPALQPSFSVSTSPSTSQASPQTVRIGTGGSKITVSEVGQNGFTGTVSLSATGLPTGVSANPASWSLQTGQSQDVVFTASSAAASGPAQITISGTSGSLTSSGQVFLNIESFVTQAVGPAGGTITVTDASSPLFGVKLEIPAGALSQSVQIGINPDGSAPTVANAIAVGSAVELRPPDLTFATPAVLSLPYPDRDGDGLVDDPNNTGMEPEFLQILFFDPPSQSWGYISSAARPEANVVVGKITHFSVYRWFFGRFQSNSTIKFSFGSLPTNRAPGVTDEAVKQSVKNALMTWQVELARSGITIVEAGPSERPDVTFSWSNNPILFENAFSGFVPPKCRNNVIAAITLRLTGVVTMPVEFNDKVLCQENDGTVDSLFAWTSDASEPPGTGSIEATALHEIGHVLGLNHPCDECINTVPLPGFAPAVMNGGGGAPLIQLLPRDQQAYRDLYGLIYAESGSGTSTLYLVDPLASGKDSAIGVIQTADGSQPIITDIALLPRQFLLNGKCCLLFGVSFDTLYIIDINPASDGRTVLATPVGPSLGAAGVNALTFDDKKNLYAASVDGVFLTVDPVSGAATNIGLYGSGFGSSGDLQFFGFFGQAPLYATVRDPLRANDLLVTINPTTGAATPVNASADLGFQFVFGLAYASTFPGPVSIGSFFTRKMFGLTAESKLIAIDSRQGTATFVRNLSFAAFGGSN